MTDVIQDIRDFMAKQGIPKHDFYELENSARSPPDGGHYCIEIAGMKRYAPELFVSGKKHSYLVLSKAR